MDTIVLAGSGRSGTTWLAGIIAANPNYRTIFEPFNSKRVPEMATLPPLAYARSDEEYPDWEPLIEDALLGKLDNKWVNRMGNRRFAQKRLVKEIRANLMLGWMDRKFNPRIVFMIRHPCAVVHSRMKQGWDAHLDEVAGQPQLIDDYLKPYESIIANATTDLQQHTVMWCIENLVPLQQLSSHDWVFSTYEDLVRSPETETKRILDALGIRPLPLLTQRAVSKISMSTADQSHIVTARDPLKAWQNQLDPSQSDEILAIVHGFGIDMYSDDILPKVSTLAKVH